MENLNPLDIIIHIVNLLVLFAILRAFLYKPVHKFLSERKAKIEGELEHAEKANKVATEELEKVQAKIDSAEADAKSSAAQIVADANEKASLIVENANDKALNIVETAKQKAKEDSDKAFEEQQDAIMDMSVSIASRVLGREISAEDNHKIVEQFFSKAGKSDD